MTGEPSIRLFAGAPLLSTGRGGDGGSCVLIDAQWGETGRGGKKEVNAGK